MFRPKRRSEYDGLGAFLPFSENGAASRAEFSRLAKIEPDSGGCLRRRLPKLAYRPL